MESPDAIPRDADLRGEAGPMHLRFQGTPGDVHSFSQHIFTMCGCFSRHWRCFSERDQLPAFVEPLSRWARMRVNQTYIINNV